MDPMIPQGETETETGFANAPSSFGSPSESLDPSELDDITVSMYPSELEEIYSRANMSLNFITCTRYQSKLFKKSTYESHKKVPVRTVHVAAMWQPRRSSLSLSLSLSPLPSPARLTLPPSPASLSLPPPPHSPSPRPPVSPSLTLPPLPPFPSIPDITLHPIPPTRHPRPPATSQDSVIPFLSPPTLISHHRSRSCRVTTSASSDRISA